MADKTTTYKLDQKPKLFAIQANQQQGSSLNHIQLKLKPLSILTSKLNGIEDFEITRTRIVT